MYMYMYMHVYTAVCVYRRMTCTCIYYYYSYHLYFVIIATCTLYMYMRQLIFLGKVTALGVLHCFALLFDVACFFLLSFSFLIKTCINAYTCTCFNVHVLQPPSQFSRLGMLNICLSIYFNNMWVSISLSLF